jgi:hypothetical protein
LVASVRKDVVDGASAKCSHEPLEASTRPCVEFQCLSKCGVIEFAHDSVIEQLLFRWAVVPSLSSSDVADLLHTARVRILGLLERRGVIERDVELRLIDDGFAEREPEAAALAGGDQADPRNRRISGIDAAEFPERTPHPLRKIGHGGGTDR